MSTATECLFCRIAKRELQADVIAEADGLLAFRDLKPQAPTHVLVIPTEHLASLAEVNEQHVGLLGRALVFAKDIAAQLGLREGGYRVVVNCGAGAGQTVWHLHLHLLGGRPMRWPPG